MNQTSPLKKNSDPQRADVIVVGSGMGGLSAACLLARDGLNVLVLEAAHVPGGCSSSFKRKGYIFESGATTLTGFDQHQPMRILEDELGINITKTELNPSMTVHLDRETITRFKDRDQWIREAGRVFGQPEKQAKFWNEAFSVADTVWKVSSKNTFFPPNSLTEWAGLAFRNHPLDARVLPWGWKSTARALKKFGVDTPLFRRFIDEQLMITAQADAENTPFLFGAAGITYTNYANYYVPGGLLNMVRELENYLEYHGSRVICRTKVISITKKETDYLIEAENGNTFQAPVVLSNIPVWNLGELTGDGLSPWFEHQATRYDQAWGAFTMGIVTGDAYPDDLTLHHQLHLSGDETMPLTGAKSVFVSFSRRDDDARAPKGERTLNISCHTPTADWFNMNGSYDANKKRVETWILNFLENRLPGFKASGVKLAFSSTPVTWQNWVLRKQGRVGGIPQSMDRSILDWTPAQTPFGGFYLCGDTVYPGQGIPGVTLSGINVYYRIRKFLNI